MDSSDDESRSPPEFKPPPCIDIGYVRQFSALDENSFVAVADFLGVDPTDLGAHREINASGKGFGDDWLAVLCQHFICNPRIVAFDGSFNKIGDAGCKSLAGVIGNTHSMHTLMLGENNITNDGIETLFQALPFSNTLTTLDLSLNTIDVDGCKAVASALNRAHVLQILDLSVNNIGDAGCEELALALQQNGTLRALFLRLNQISNRGLESLCAMLKVNQALHELSLCDNAIGLDGAVAFAQALEYNTFLSRLDLSNNHIPQAGVAALHRALAAEPMRGFQSLGLQGNPVSKRSIADLERQRRDNTLRAYVAKEAERVGLEARIELRKEGQRRARRETERQSKEGQSKEGQSKEEYAEEKGREEKGDGRAEAKDESRPRSRGTRVEAKAEATRKLGAIKAKAKEELEKATWAECENGKMAVAQRLGELRLADHSARAQTGESLDDGDALCVAECLRGGSGFVVSTIDTSQGNIGLPFTAVDLSHNEITDVGCAALALALSVCHRISALDLSHNAIRDDGASALGAMLRDNCTLTELRVGNNKIGDTGIEAIAHGVHENRASAILLLQMEGNRATGIGLDAMAAAQRAHELREGLREQLLVEHGTCDGTDDPETTADLRDKGINYLGADVIVDVLRRRQASWEGGLEEATDGGRRGRTGSLQRSASLPFPLVPLPPLTTLLLTHNRLQNAGAQSVATFLEDDHHLTRVDLSCNSVGDEGAVALAAMLKQNNTLRVLGLRAGVSNLGGGQPIPTYSVEQLREGRQFDMQIGDKGASALAEVLASGNATLVSLDLSENLVRAEGRRCLCEAMKSNSTMLKIDGSDISVYLVRTNGDIDIGDRGEVDNAVIGRSSADEAFRACNYAFSQ
jgi:Ran GTPase-activating protein (RanGAP) involved in mRNA processing and transport